MDVSERVIPDNFEHGAGRRRSVIKLNAKLKDKVLSAFSSLFKLIGMRTKWILHDWAHNVHCSLSHSLFEHAKFYLRSTNNVPQVKLTNVEKGLSVYLYIGINPYSGIEMTDFCFVHPENCTQQSRH